MEIYIKKFSIKTVAVGFWFNPSGESQIERQLIIIHPIKGSYGIYNTYIGECVIIDNKMNLEMELHQEKDITGIFMLSKEICGIYTLIEAIDNDRSAIKKIFKNFNNNDYIKKYI